MRGSYYLLLVFPVSILVAGFMVLGFNLSAEKSVSFPVINVDSTVNETKQADTILSNGKGSKSINREVRTDKVIKKESSVKPEKVNNQEKALPYFILFAVLIVLILALPRLSELSISEKSIVLKLFNEVKAAADDLDNDTGQVGSESFRTRLPNEKIQKLRERIDLVDKVLRKGK